MTLGTRAVLVRILADGDFITCDVCGERIVFRARIGIKNKVVVNLYEDGKWSRVIQYHQHCYEESKNPHGIPVLQDVKKRVMR